MYPPKKDSLSLTPQAIARVREGVAAASNPVIRRTIRETRSRLAAGDVPPHLSGAVRRLVLRSLTHTLFDISVENRQALPDGAAILVSNHLNHFDALILLAELPPRPFYYVLGDARTLFNKEWKRCVLHYAGGVIPVDRMWGEERAVLEAVADGRDFHGEDLVQLAQRVAREVPTGGGVRTLREIGRAVQTTLDRGEGVLVFAEGRLGQQEGRLQLPLKRGTALYALRAGVPVVPVCLTGVNDLFLRKKITVRFGEPLVVRKSDRPKRGEIDDLLLKIEVGLGGLLTVDYCEPGGVKLFRYCLNHVLY